MVVAEIMNKPVLKVSMDSDSEDSSSVEESAESDNELEEQVGDPEDNGDDEDDEVDDAEEGESDEEAEDGSDADGDAEAGESEDADDGIDADAESAGSSDDDEDKKDSLMTNEGWADSIAKILGSNKPKNKKSLVLSRAKKHSEIVKAVKEEKPAFEVIGDEVEEKPSVKKEDPDSSEPPAKKVKHDKPSIRVKPNVLEKDRERVLSKIATKGVVQLFNAVRNQQKTLEKEIDRNDLSEHKKEKILKKFDKRAFLDTLMGQSKSVVVDEEAKVAKSEVKDESNTKWSALRDDFMMGAKMKDWDRESVDE
ncbi:RRP15-like protein [Anticarsia gemmatalis]|uniref:RRP15-like protein n=1 Tax=Anticarsia gemmatalis TaxID=129554 RepID=UPI003F75AEBD